jgi:hypothetical protein
MIISLLFGLYIVYDLFITRKQDTIILTYYGFAVFAALSNICFSYCRTFDNASNDQIYLQNIGEKFLFSSIGFLIGSVLNYTNVNSTKFFKEPLATVFLYMSEFVGSIFFVSSFFFAVFAVHSLLDHLYEKLHLNKDNYYLEK